MAEEPVAAEEFNMACFKLSRSLAEIDLNVPEAAPLVRVLLRTCGRIVIDTGAPGADPSIWVQSEAMALRWLDDALQPLGYRIVPSDGGGRPDLVPESATW